MPKSFETLPEEDIQPRVLSRLIDIVNANLKKYPNGALTSDQAIETALDTYKDNLSNLQGIQGNDQRSSYKAKLRQIFS